MTDPQNNHDAYDSPWKGVLEHAFPEFMAFYFPDAYTQIDWAQGHEFRNTELRQVVRDAELGKRFADAGTPLPLILRPQRGEKWPDARRASTGIASSISSSRNNAAGCFSPRPEGASQTRPGGVTALGNRDPIPCARCLAWARLEGL